MEPHCNGGRASGATYLLSDAAAHLSGHILRSDGQELNIMRTPSAQGPFARREQWSVAGIGHALRDELAQ